MTFEQFQYGFANELDEEEARRLYGAYAVPVAGTLVFQGALANINPWTEDKVDTGNPDRGPLLIIVGEKDHTVPASVSKADYERQRKNAGVTQYREIAARGHSLAMDHGWKDVADVALAFVREHAPSN